MNTGRRVSDEVQPTPSARLEFTIVDLVPGTGRAFAATLSAAQSTLQGETLWFRMVAGETAPRYARLRPPNLSSNLDRRRDEHLPGKVNALIAMTIVEILSLLVIDSPGRPEPSLAVDY